MTDHDPEMMEAARQAVIQMLATIKGESRTCLRCGQELTTIEKHEHCLYGVPCGCRLWQADELPEWVKEKG